MEGLLTPVAAEAAAEPAAAADAAPLLHTTLRHIVMTWGPVHCIVSLREKYSIHPQGFCYIKFKD